MLVSAKSVQRSAIAFRPIDNRLAIAYLTQLLRVRSLYQPHHQKCVEALLLVARHRLFDTVAQSGIAFMRV
jgi:hypothetical protein